MSHGFESNPSSRAQSPAPTSSYDLMSLKKRTAGVVADKGWYPEGFEDTVKRLENFKPGGKSGQTYYGSFDVNRQSKLGIRPPSDIHLALSVDQSQVGTLQVKLMEHPTDAPSKETRPGTVRLDDEIETEAYVRLLSDNTGPE